MYATPTNPLKGRVGFSPFQVGYIHRITKSGFFTNPDPTRCADEKNLI